MSGICGIRNLDGRPVSAEDIAPPLAVMHRRGRDGCQTVVDGDAGLGHATLIATPEAAIERQPFRHEETGVVITADLRIDNRDELLEHLMPGADPARTGDAELVLRAWLEWAEACPEHLLGDFAFGLWDPRTATMFCARDHLGMKQMAYTLRQGEIFAFATDAEAVAAFERVPRMLNEVRVLDFAVGFLEGGDRTTTFFKDVYRLPAGHTLVMRNGAVQVTQYWKPTARPLLKLSSDEEYAEAFREVFSRSVHDRLRVAGPPASMLSGGMDSGTVVTVAADILKREGRGPIKTFSAVGPDPETCIETRAIMAASEMERLEPHFVDWSKLDGVREDVIGSLRNMIEPFDGHMNLPRTIYLLARRENVRVVLDGVGGDAMMNPGSFVHRLIRRFQLRDAWSEFRGRMRYFGVTRTIDQARRFAVTSVSAFLPAHLRDGHRRLLAPAFMREIVKQNHINPKAANRLDLLHRLEAIRLIDGSPYGHSPQEEAARAIGHSYQACGRERYDRVAAEFGMETRDPFMDRRVAELCIALPSEQKLSQGWPKHIVRNTVKDRMPDAMRLRRSKEHLGWTFTCRFLETGRDEILADTSRDLPSLERIWSVNFLDRVPDINFEPISDELGSTFELWFLVLWLRRTGFVQAANAKTEIVA